MMRKALVVGIDNYLNVPKLYGCVNDSIAVKAMLERNADDSINFHVRHLVSGASDPPTTRENLRGAIKDLFEGDGEVALLYFAGHGHAEATGGYLCSSDIKSGHDGIPLAEIMTMANKSRFQNRVVILDSCYSGVAASDALQSNVSEISEGVTILTASTAEQYATEENGAGVFSSLLVDALGGAAANLVGEVTPGGVYAHVDQSLGSWAQRPVFKTNVHRFISLRKVKPALAVSELRRISEFFPAANYSFKLDPTYEPERGVSGGSDPCNLPPPNPEHNAVFEILQKYNRVGLLAPQGAPHMWHAAMQSKCVKLTPLGEHYRRLAAKALI